MPPIRWIWRELDPALCCGEILQVSLQAYAREAELIGAVDFPPLAEREEDIAASPNNFFGAMTGEILAAVVEIYEIDRGWDISRIVVGNDYPRQGAGHFLLASLFERHPSDVWTVSTSAFNKPALALYSNMGFQPLREWKNAAGYELVELERVSR